MTQLRQPQITVTYNDKDITADVSKYLTDFTYTDKEHGASDDISLSFDDKQMKWQNEWYPDKAARLKVSFGFIGRMVSAGTFQINSFELSGPPDIANIGGLAAGITKDVRTKKSASHENTTLKQIAEKTAQANGFTLAGDTIAEINIKRASQNKETDLAFLKRSAEEYGYIFSLRDSVMTFHDIYALEDVEPVAAVDKTECSDYHFRNKIAGSYKSAKLKHTKSSSKASISANADIGILSSAQQQTNSADVLVIHHRVEDELQAKFKVKAALHKHNKRLSEVDVTCDGNPYLLAGNNVDLTGFGECSGTYHITESKHTISKGGGYNTTFTAHKIKVPAPGAKRPKKTPPQIAATPTRPGYTPVYDFTSLNG